MTSDDEPADTATSAATPDDPANPDGYYWLFSSLTGPHPFTASKSMYSPRRKRSTWRPTGRPGDFSWGRAIWSSADVDHDDAGARRDLEQTLPLKNNGTGTATSS